jgi:cellulose synthase/poly-beta-1,6-N-acetylglucosamine synthase-like glycosyltransferase
MSFIRNIIGMFHWIWNINGDKDMKVIKCPDCNGTGNLDNDMIDISEMLPCPRCEGTGVVYIIYTPNKSNPKRKLLKTIIRMGIRGIGIYLLLFYYYYILPLDWYMSAFPKAIILFLFCIILALFNLDWLFDLFWSFYIWLWSDERNG